MPSHKCNQPRRPWKILAAGYHGKAPAASTYGTNLKNWVLKDMTNDILPESSISGTSHIVAHTFRVFLCLKSMGVKFKRTLLPHIASKLLQRHESDHEFLGSCQSVWRYISCSFPFQRPVHHWRVDMVHPGRSQSRCEVQEDVDAWCENA